MHLESIQINEKDNLIQKIQKINEGNKIRVNQIEIINQNISNSPYPVILCGDMNDSPHSYAYNKINIEYELQNLDNGNNFTDIRFWSQKSMSSFWVLYASFDEIKISSKLSEFL